MWSPSANAPVPFPSTLCFMDIVLVYICVSKLCDATEEDFSGEVMGGEVMVTHCVCPGS